MTTVQAASRDQRTRPSDSVPRTHAIMTLNRSLASNGISTWVSGSPKRQLYSSTAGPSFVIMNPAYSTPWYGQPSAAMAATVACTMPMHW